MPLLPKCFRIVFKNKYSVYDCITSVIIHILCILVIFILRCIASMAKLTHHCLLSSRNEETTAFIRPNLMHRQDLIQFYILWLHRLEFKYVLILYVKKWSNDLTYYLCIDDSTRRRIWQHINIDKSDTDI